MRKILMLAALLSSSAAAWASPSEWIDRNQTEILREYLELLAIPNTASDRVNIRRNADRLVSMMEERGLNPRLLEVDGDTVPPAVYGEWLVPGATRTLILYAHYDGQPATAEGWTSSKPFEPRIRTGRLDKGGEVVSLPAGDGPVDPDWRIYARSASDDKAGVMAILWAASALKAEGAQPAFNVKIFLDGEEEAGSPNLETILRKNADLLQSDGWVIIDGPAHPNGTPQVVLGVRGDVNVDLTVYGPVRPLHSGHYGNWAPNPAMMLSQLLASMKDESGRVTVAGFYDDVVPLTPAERALLAEYPSADASLRHELGLGWTEGGGRSLLELINEPSLNINGIRSADAGEGARNVIPAVAMATLDLRLVKGNDHRRQFAKIVEHVKAQGFTVLDREPTIEERRRHPRIATVVARPGYNAERTELDNPLAMSVVAAAREAGPAVVLPTIGGSLPLHVIRETLGAPTVTVSFANHDNNQHAEDENIRIGSLLQGIPLVAELMTWRCRFSMDPETAGSPVASPGSSKQT